MPYSITVQHVDQFPEGDSYTFTAVNHSISDVVFEEVLDDKTGQMIRRAARTGVYRLEIVTERNGIVVFADSSMFVYTLGRDWQEAQDRQIQEEMQKRANKRYMDTGGREASPNT